MDEVLDSIKQPVWLGDIKHRYTASIGVAAFPMDAETSDGLFKAADMALYHSNSQLRTPFVLLCWPARINSASVDYEEAKRRHMVAQAIIAEVEADLKSGAVVEIADVVQGVMAEYALLRNLLLGICSKIAPRAAALKSAEEVKALIDEEVCRALDELTQDNEWTERERFCGRMKATPVTNVSNTSQRFRFRQRVTN